MALRRVGAACSQGQVLGMCCTPRHMGAPSAPASAQEMSCVQVWECLCTRVCIRVHVHAHPCVSVCTAPIRLLRDRGPDKHAKCQREARQHLWALQVQQAGRSALEWAPPPPPLPPSPSAHQLRLWGHGSWASVRRGGEMAPPSARYQGQTKLPSRAEGRFWSLLQDTGRGTQSQAIVLPVLGSPSGKWSQPSPVPTNKAGSAHSGSGRPPGDPALRGAC